MFDLVLKVLWHFSLVFFFLKLFDAVIVRFGDVVMQFSLLIVISERKNGKASFELMNKRLLTEYYRSITPAAASSRIMNGTRITGESVNMARLIFLLRNAGMS